MQTRIGRKFGRLTVEERVSPPNTKNPQYSCVCECGEKKIARWNNLKAGGTKSCGCLAKEHVANLVAIGMQNDVVRQKLRAAKLLARPKAKSSHDLYQTWATMINRCYNPANRKFKYYGQRGITVCETWLDSFWSFADDMGERPDGHTVDRIDPTGNYSPDNCRWADNKTQCDNRRTKRDVYVVKLWSPPLTLGIACRKLGVKYDTVAEHIRRGDTPEFALISTWFRKKHFLENSGAGGYGECLEQARKFLADRPQLK